ncbi:hypothetical protein JOC77_000992 [Peribacillus deserti]|uniref:Transposase n=2 Tax=Peribacillus deserti TaxID=673318 RepID=A0ABS2QF37_9BACI|nr:hypothetical protein [Peribacillus deserti]MBM7691585.1 hypothetical protein [Peribacillus deserti]
MLGINRHGNQSAIKPVIGRIKTLLKRKRKSESGELTTALGFLIRFMAEYEEIRYLFDWLKSNKWDFLFEMEKRWIIKNIKSL